MRQLTRILLLAVALGTSPAGSLGQSLPPTVRVGVTMATFPALGADFSIPVAGPLGVLLVVRGLDSGADCAGLPGNISPCTIDGTTLAGGLRIESGPGRWGGYLELFGGVHHYSGGDDYGMVGGGFGLTYRISGRLSAEVGYDVRVLDADRVDPLDYFVVGDGHRTGRGLRVAMGAGIG